MIWYKFRKQYICQNCFTLSQTFILAARGVCVCIWCVFRSKLRMDGWCTSLSSVWWHHQGAVAMETGSLVHFSRSITFSILTWRSDPGRKQEHHIHIYRAWLMSSAHSKVIMTYTHYWWVISVCERVSSRWSSVSCIFSGSV